MSRRQVAGLLGPGSGGAERYPYVEQNVAKESFLPIHPDFRPDMVLPRLGGDVHFFTPPQRRNQKPSQAQVVQSINSKVEEIIEELSSKGKFLPSEAVRRVLMDLIQKARSQNHVNISMRDIMAFSQFSKLHGRIDELIKIYCMYTPVTSLHELGIALACSEKVSSYEELHLGPLIKHPRARDYFKPPDDVECAPEITVQQLHGHLTKLVDKTKRGSKHSLEDYLEFVRKKYGLESVAHLCLRIQSFPLLIQTNFRFRTSQSQLRRRMQEQLESEMNTLLQHETDMLKRKFSDPRNDDPLSVLKGLSGKDPVQILVSVYEGCMNYLNPFQKNKMTMFFQWAIKDQKVRHLFLLAIYKGAYSADKLLPSFFEESQSRGCLVEVHPEQQQQMLYRTEGEVFTEVLQRLRELPSPLDLPALVSVEQCTAEKFGVCHFSELGNGSFLGFVSRHVQLVEELGEGVAGGCGSSAHVIAAKQKVLGIIAQLGQEVRGDEEAASAAVTAQLGVDTFLELGCGKMGKMIAEYDRAPGKVKGQGIAYLTPILVNTKSRSNPAGTQSLSKRMAGQRSGQVGVSGQRSGVPGQRSGQVGMPGQRSGVQGQSSGQVGVLGHQSRREAWKCLRSAPLLTDLCEWSLWDLVFHPQFGSLSDFLFAKSALDSDEDRVSVLEVSPGKLLRVSSDSSIQDFYSAVDCYDAVGVAGHLVSLIVMRGNAQDISPQLLARHMTASLERRLVKTEETVAEREKAVCDFVFRCLVRIPLKICEIIATEIFIDPLRKVAGSCFVSDLIQCSSSPEQRRFFQALGMCLGYEKWAEDWKEMMTVVRQEVGVVGEGSERSSVAELSTAQESGPLSKVPSEPTVLGKPDIIPASDALSTAHAAPPTTASTEEGTPTPRVAEITPEQLQEKESACRAIIETIRHEEFGIGVELDGEQQKVAAKQREREGRGIKRLSLELYSKDTHFVLELIQNADDNSYPGMVETGTGKPEAWEGLAGATPPSLKFVVGEDSILVLNNEVGFTESNIRAICDVGKSTKGAHRSGYIGQKGIGFKSVFRITDNPSIHSNGFRIHFDATSDAIGFILPHWCGEEVGGAKGEEEEEEEDSAKKEENEELKNWMTRIVLPLKSDLVASNMAKKFSDVQPSLLLFLHRLRSITVEDKVSNGVRRMVRQDKTSGIVEIAHTNNSALSTDRWFVVRKVLDKAKQFKPEVDATELALAFPLPPELKSAVLSKDLSQQQVFAFLPLRSYGFRFIIQGDFDLPSSRECVTSDSPWNQWLREEIPSLFLHGLETIKAYATESGDMTDIEALALFLQFVPLEGELLDFFHPLTAQVLTLLRGTSCLPTDPLHLRHADTSPTSFASLVTPASLLYMAEELVLWKRPSQVLYVRDEFIREHISQVILEKALNLSYLHSSMLPYVNFSLQGQLGIQRMTIDHLKEVAEVAIQHFQGRGCSKSQVIMIEDSDTDTDSDIFEGAAEAASPREVFVKWIANWLGCVHVLMEEGGVGGSGLHSLMASTLRDLSILPLEGGSFVAAAAQSGIFFPPDYRGSEEDDSDKRYREIHEEMSVLDSALFDEGDELVQSRVRKVLEYLGVRPLQSSDVIRHHILPQFKQKLAQFKQNKKKSNKLLVKYLQYIKECTSQRGSGMSEQEVIPLLKDCVLLLTNKGPKLVTEVKVHFSSEYGNQPDIVQMFPDVKWVTVSADYLERAFTPAEKLAWVSFLDKIGVKKGIVIEQVIEKVPKGSPKWKELADSSVKRLPDVDCILKDWQSCEFMAIVDSASKKSPALQRNQMKTLAELLDRNWDSVYAHRLETHVYNAKNDSFLEITVPSSFSKCLVQRAWLPSTLPVGSKVLYRGSELFNRASTRIKSLLHTHAPYLDASLQSGKLLAHLQVRSIISKSDLLQYLMSWSNATTRDDDATFWTSVDHMCSVYCYLLEDGGDQEIIDQLTDDSPPLIFVPSRFDEGVGSCDDVKGRFLSVRDVCWMDPTTVLRAKQKHNRPLPDILPRVLSLHYKHQMQDTFKQIRINETPLIRIYVVLLKYISSLSVEPEIEHVRDFTSIVTHLVHDCTEHRAYLTANLKGSGVKIFPSHRRVWVSLSDCLLENDDPKLAKTFSKMDDVHFIQWPAKFAEIKHWNRAQMQECKEEFLRICAIHKLSDEVQMHIYHGGISMPLEELKAKISLWVPLIQMFLFHYCKDQYDRLTESGIIEHLSRLQVFTAQELKCLYYIEHEGRNLESPDPASRICALEIDVSGLPTIYVVEKKKDKTPTYLMEPLMKLFARGAGEDEESDFQKFLNRLLSDLPEDAEDVDQLAADYELSQLGESEQEWVVPLPKRAQVEEESSSGEESYEDANDIHEGGIAREEADTRNDEDKPMTSWPPKAAIDPAPSSQKRRDPGTVAPRAAGPTVDTGTIGEEELREVRRKHSLENEQTPRPADGLRNAARLQGGPDPNVAWLQGGPRDSPREGISSEYDAVRRELGQQQQGDRGEGNWHP